MSKLEARLLEPALCLPFAGKPTCLAYDVKEKYIAIGCDNGKVSVLSKSGSEQVKVLSHDSCQPVKLMSFCYEKTTDKNKAFLVTTLEEDPTVFLWSFTDESKCVSKTALGSGVTVLTWSPNCSLYYVGTEAGDVVVLTVTGSESGSPILDLSKPLSKPAPANSDDYGRVVAVEESKEKGRLLIVFSSGKCLVRENKSAVPYAIINEIPVAAWWKKSEESFSVVCKSGYLFSIDRNKTTKIADRVKIGRDGITKVQRAVSTATKEVFIAYTGGAPAVIHKEYEKSHVITMYHTDQHANALEQFNANVMDFVFLPREEGSSTKPLLAVVTESEIVILDTSTKEKCGYGLMRYSCSTSYPYIVSPVTSLQHCGECSQEFMEKVLLISSQTDEEKEIPQLVVTGHSDGSIRLWLCYCNGGSPSFELLRQMIVYTERYFDPLQNDSSPNKEGKQESLLSGVKYAKVIDSQYLLVIKESNRVLLFDLTNKSEENPQSQEIVLQEDQDGSLSQPEALSTPPPHFHPYQHKHVKLLQHFSCHYQKKCAESLEPVTVNCVVYNGQMKMLAVGTEYGLVVLDIKENMLVQVIGSENKLLKLSLGSNEDTPGCSKKCCDVVCLESLKVSLKEDEDAQHTLWVGTRGGSLGALNIIRESGNVLELEATELGKVNKKSALRGIHFNRMKITEFIDERQQVILYATVYVAVITEKHFQTYQIPGLAGIGKEIGHIGIMWSGLIQCRDGKPFIIYVTKGGHKLAGYCLTDINHIFSKSLPVGCQPVEQDLFSSNGKHAIMKCSDSFYYIMDSA